VGADLIILSSDSEDELTGKRSSPRMKLSGKLLPSKMMTTSSPWVAGPCRGSDGGLECAAISPHFDVGIKEIEGRTIQS
jgi:hypothetical protein